MWRGIGDLDRIGIAERRQRQRAGVGVGDGEGDGRDPADGDRIGAERLGDGRRREVHDEAIVGGGRGRRLHAGDGAGGVEIRPARGDAGDIDRHRTETAGRDRGPT